MTTFITASQAYKEYSIPRSVLRQLAEDGSVERVEKNLFGGKVMNLYRRSDIERYLDGQ